MEAVTQLTPAAGRISQNLKISKSFISSITLYYSILADMSLFCFACLAIRATSQLIHEEAAIFFGRAINKGKEPVEIKATVCMCPRFSPLQTAP